MFMASVGKESEVDVFQFFLADRLGLTLRQVEAMPSAEYVGWVSYHKVRNQQAELQAKAARHG